MMKGFPPAAAPIELKNPVTKCRHGVFSPFRLWTNHTGYISTNILDAIV